MPTQAKRTHTEKCKFCMSSVPLLLWYVKQTYELTPTVTFQNSVNKNSLFLCSKLQWKLFAFVPPPLAKSSLTLLKVTISKFKHTVLTPVWCRPWQLPTVSTGKSSPGWTAGIWRKLLHIKRQYQGRIKVLYEMYMRKYKCTDIMI